MSKYSRVNKLLHNVYLGNPFLSKSSFEIEESLFGNASKKIDVQQKVFVTGLARSGTTSLMRTIFQSEEYASLQYANMPFLFLPNLWKNNKKVAQYERSHKDGILIDNDSPEAFDEYFWKVFLKNSYIGKHLNPHDISAEVLEKYELYIALICHAKTKNKYLSKNNNNILRLSSLLKLKKSKIFILFRSPAQHASSLLKLHLAFSKNQVEEPFIQNYFNYLGHHEFGENHKPFNLYDTNIEDRYAIDTLNYWLVLWKNYYSYLLENYNSSFLLISFEDLIQKPNIVYDFVNENLEIDLPQTSYSKHSPAHYESPFIDPKILEGCDTIYEELCKLKKYTPR